MAPDPRQSEVCCAFSLDEGQFLLSTLLTPLNRLLWDDDVGLFRDQEYLLFEPAGLHLCLGVLYYPGHELELGPALELGGRVFCRVVKLGRCGGFP